MMKKQKQTRNDQIQKEKLSVISSQAVLSGDCHNGIRNIFSGIQNPGYKRCFNVI